MTPEVHSLPNLLRRSMTAGLILGAMSLCGCTSLLDSLPSAGPVHQPTNVYRGVEKLPANVKRVAVLPLRGDTKDHATDLLRPSLQKALWAELSKNAAFELIAVRAEQLDDWTGRRTWAGHEELPEGLLARIQAATGCDGILFSELTGFRAYPPLAIGWKLRLIDAEGTRVWWAADEWFDASDAAVANAARKHYLAHTPRPHALADTQQILYSPLRFGTYTASVLAATCPSHSYD